MLGLVCQEWRELSLSMPQLWNHPPIIHITLNSLKTDHFKESWEEFLHRSGSLSLKLHLYFDDAVDKILRGPCEILTPFLDRAERWEHLTISGLRLRQAQVQLNQLRTGRLCVLRSATLNFTEATNTASDKFDILEFAPKLTHINLHCPSSLFGRPRFCFPWAQLASYTETGIDNWTLSTVLNLSDQLETLQYRGRSLLYISTGEIAQFNLRHLIVEANYIEGFWRQLADVTFPALETFSVRALRHTDRPLHISTLTKFIVRSGCFLKKLVLDFTPNSMYNMGMEDLFSHTDDLETLELGDCYSPGSHERVLSSLIFREEHATLLPRLRFLTLHNREGSGWSNGSIISDVALSREKVIVGSTRSRRLLSPLEYLRIIIPKIYDRHNTLCDIMNATAPATQVSPHVIVIRVNKLT